jgi:uncharacterized membrane protein
MIKNTLLSAFLLLLTVAAASADNWQSYESYGLLSLTPSGINDSGAIVGQSNGQAVLDVGGTLSAISVPGSLFTVANAINDAGEIVGSYALPSYAGGAFTDVDGTYTTFSYPGAGLTRAAGVNAAGEVVGNYQLTDCAICYNQGFTYSDGTLTTLDDPGAVETFASAINDSGQIVGTITGGIVDGTAGFLYSAGTWTTIDYQGSSDTVVTGIDDDGAVVGYYMAGGLPWAFTWQAGVFYPFALPAQGWWTEVNGGSLNGVDLVGEFGKSAGDPYDFYSPGPDQGASGNAPEPSTLMLLGAGAALMLALKVLRPARSAGERN